MTRFRTRLAISVAALLLLGAAAGCAPLLAISSQAISLGLGWLLRDATVTTTTQTQCYQNGVLIDCSELPANVVGGP